MDGGHWGEGGSGRVRRREGGRQEGGGGVGGREYGRGRGGREG